MDKIIIRIFAKYIFKFTIYQAQFSENWSDFKEVSFKTFWHMNIEREM